MKKNYLIIADYHSKFLLVEPLGNSATSEKIAQLTSKIISVFGVPNAIISDNGLQFQGTAYQSLMKKLGISHITSSPHHPKSHLFIERMTRTIENFMKKSDDLDAALVNFSGAPFGPQMPSPSDILFGRKIMSHLAYQSILEDSLIHPSDSS